MLTCIKPVQTIDIRLVSVIQECRCQDTRKIKSEAKGRKAIALVKDDRTPMFSRNGYDAGGDAADDNRTDEDDEYDEEDEEDGGQAGNMLAFMLGNVNEEGSLDENYMDEVILILVVCPLIFLLGCFTPWCLLRSGRTRALGVSRSAAWANSHRIRGKGFAS